MKYLVRIEVEEELCLPSSSSSGDILPDALSIHLAAKHREQAEAHLNRHFEKFVPTKIKIIVAAGATYEMKIDCGSGESIVIKVFVPQHGPGGSCLIGIKQQVVVASK